MSASATGSTPATRRATRELQSLEKVGAWLSKLPQLGRGAAMAGTCLSISVYSARRSAPGKGRRVDEARPADEGALESAREGSGDRVWRAERGWDGHGEPRRGSRVAHEAGATISPMGHPTATQPAQSYNRPTHNFGNHQKLQKKRAELMKRVA